MILETLVLLRFNFSTFNYVWVGVSESKYMYVSVDASKGQRLHPPGAEAIDAWEPSDVGTENQIWDL